MVSAVVTKPRDMLKDESSRTLIVKGFPSGIDHEGILQWIMTLSNVDQYYPKCTTKGTMNVLHVVFHSQEDAMMWMKHINDEPYQDWKLSSILFDSDYSKKTTVCVKNIPLEWDKEDLQEYCSVFGEVISCVIYEKGNRIGFVRFASAEECQVSLILSEDPKTVEIISLLRIE